MNREKLRRIRIGIGREWEEVKKEIISLTSPIFILCAIYGAAFFAIIRANFNYWDDLGRKHSGYHGWLDWSRWFTTITSNFVHADWYLTDISPLPQLLACLLLAFGGILMLYILGGQKKISMWNILAVSLTGLTPYFLGIISYKYDSPYMAFSFCISIVPFLFYRRNEIAYAIVSIASLLLMCTSYQLSSGVYPLMVLFIAAGEINRGQNIGKLLRFILVSIASYIFSMVFFSVFLMKENEVGIPSIMQLIPSVIRKFLTFYENIANDFKLSWLVLMFLLVVVFLSSFILSSTINKLAAMGIGVLTVFGGSILCFGVLLVIDREQYDGRTMYGFGIFLSLLAVCISYTHIHKLYQWAYVSLFWCFFTFSFTYGNALADQQRYLDYRIQLIAGDLNSLEEMDRQEIKKIRVGGGYRLVARHYQYVIRL